MAQAERLAARQGRTADELAADALKRYIAHEWLNKLDREGQERWRRPGMKSEEEVEREADRAIAESRNEQRCQECITSRSIPISKSQQWSSAARQYGCATWRSTGKSKSPFRSQSSMKRGRYCATSSDGPRKGWRKPRNGFAASPSLYAAWVLGRTVRSISFCFACRATRSS